MNFSLEAQKAISDAIVPECELDPVYQLPWTRRMSPMEFAWRALRALDEAGFTISWEEQPTTEES